MLDALATTCWPNGLAASAISAAATALLAWVAWVEIRSDGGK